VAKGIHARRYAQAIFEIALTRQELDRWLTDLGIIVRLGKDPGIIAFLESPKYSFDDKAKLLTEHLTDLSPMALNLVYLLVMRGRLGMVGDIAVEYQRRLDDYHGIAPAEIITAVPLNDEDERRLSEHLGVLIGKKVVLKTEVDASLVGGVIARVGGKLLDGSVRNKLEVLKRELGGAGV